ncbi:MAG: hypothetical protein JOZ54_09875, partial [Acidobacteria bacterium]|nr:hypothetical protein [Acidobacteriota bacterium]
MSTSPVLTSVEEAVAPAPAPRVQWVEIASWLLIGAALLFVLFRHLVGGLVGGLALFLILDGLAQRFQRRMGSAARPLALLAVALIAGGIAIGGIALTISFARHHADNIPAMMTKMADILESTR